MSNYDPSDCVDGPRLRAQLVARGIIVPASAAPTATEHTGPCLRLRGALQPAVEGRDYDMPPREAYRVQQGDRGGR